MAPTEAEWTAALARLEPVVAAPSVVEVLRAGRAERLDGSAV